MDIVTGCDYPANKLSNFEEYHFMIDAVVCHSMEGFLQSLKFEDVKKQTEVCRLFGVQAKYKGKKKKWWKTQTLYWQGVQIDRHGKRYQQLLLKAFRELAKNHAFQKVLLDTGEETITHSEGKNDATKTVLTEDEFCCLLMTIREEIRDQ